MNASSTPANTQANALVVFADIAGSTALYESIGDVEAQKQISKCLKIASQIIQENEGTVVKYIGDEILSYFLNPDQGIDTCCQILTAFRDLTELRDTSLGMKIGFYAGPILHSENDIFGDTVNTAARMVGVAKAGQIICDHSSIEPHSKRFSYRPITYAQVKGKAEPIHLCEVIWAPDDTDLTFLSTHERPSKKTRFEWVLELSHNETYQLTKSNPSISMGRVNPVDICIESQHASRQHAKIFTRHSKAVLQDQSTNGTFVINDQGEELYVHREEVTLGHEGQISLGLPIKDNTPFIIQYRLKFLKKPTPATRAPKDEINA